mgnify:CR=1 FL=1
MADEIEELTGIKPELVPGSRGVFDVKVDNELVFSKYAVNRFPEVGEMAALVKE